MVRKRTLRILNSQRATYGWKDRTSRSIEHFFIPDKKTLTGFDQDSSVFNTTYYALPVGPERSL